MIPDPGALAVFAAASLALAVVPGPAVLYVVAQSVHGGRRAGVVSAFGVSTGGMFHVLAAVVGLSAVLAASAEAFTAVKLAGAAYLVYLGIRTLLSRDDRIAGRGAESTLARTYRRGVVVNVLNPKTALFFLAFLPQFVDPDGSTRGQLAVLGILFVVIALTTDLVWALVAGTAGAVLRRSRTFLRVQRYVSGTIFVGPGRARRDDWPLSLTVVEPGSRTAEAAIVHSWKTLTGSCAWRPEAGLAGREAKPALPPRCAEGGGSWGNHGFPHATQPPP